MAVETLESYLGGRWSRGQGTETELIDPTTGDILATASAKGLDFAGALAYARQHGGPALRALSYAERAKLLSAVADVLGANRARYEEIAIANSGNTKIDAAIDIDGGIATLKYYARLGAGLGGAKALLDENPVRLAKAENFQAIHMQVPRHGVAVHINAFNFPSWGLWEKAACALLSGMPMLAKPASATCWLSHQMVRDVIAAKVLPDGALSLLCGGIGDLLDHVTADDVIAFTGSSGTAQRIVAQRHVLARGTRVNIEADSVNAALLAPGVSAATPAFDSFVKEVAKEMTQKAGQKCTAIRRVFVPVQQANAVTDALAARLAKVTVGDPRNEKTRMGPLVTRAQQDAAFDGIRRLAEEADFVTGSLNPPTLDGIDGDKSAFVAPTLLKVENGTGNAVHDVEVFGPCATISRIRMSPKPLPWSRAAAARWWPRSMARTATSSRARRWSSVPATAVSWRSSRPLLMPIPATALSCRNAITAALAAPATAPSSAAFTACASTTSAWRCRARRICSARCRQRRRRATKCHSGSRANVRGAE